MRMWRRKLLKWVYSNLSNYLITTHIFIIIYYGKTLMFYRCGFKFKLNNNKKITNKLEAKDK